MEAACSIPAMARPARSPGRGSGGSSASPTADCVQVLVNERPADMLHPAWIDRSFYAVTGPETGPYEIDFIGADGDRQHYHLD